MKKPLYLGAAATLGFLVAAWTPLGDQASIANIAHVSGLNQLVGRAGFAPIGVRTEFLEQVRPFAGSSGYLKQKTALKAMKKGFVDHAIDAVLNRAVDPQASAEGEALIAGLQDENRRIETGLADLPEGNPERYAQLANYTSNLGVIDISRFMINLDPETFTGESLADLAGTLSDYTSTAIGHVNTGHVLVSQVKMMLEQESPANATEEELYTMMMNFLEAFEVSLEVEGAIASNVSAFPTAFVNSISQNDPAYLNQWATALEELVNLREDMRVFRILLAMQISEKAGMV